MGDWFIIFYVWLVGVGTTLAICSFCEDWEENYSNFILVALTWPIVLGIAAAVGILMEPKEEENG